jgi:hypothetical protein
MCPARNQPVFTLRDKYKILSTKQVTSALTTLAHFHGSWWHWLNNSGNSESKINNLNRKQVRVAMTQKLPIWMLSGMIKKTGK